MGSERELKEVTEAGKSFIKNHIEMGGREWESEREREKVVYRREESWASMKWKGEWGKGRERRERETGCKNGVKIGNFRNSLNKDEKWGWQREWEKVGESVLHVFVSVKVQMREQERPIIPQLFCFTHFKAFVKGQIHWKFLFTVRFL